MRWGPVAMTAALTSLLAIAVEGTALWEADRARQDASPALPPVTRPSPPAQPASGPGGRAYLHRAVQQLTGGAGAEAFWVFYPIEPTPARAPVVVFVHGWGAVAPDPYLAWIGHLVRRGMIVIYPRYQATLVTFPAVMTDYALEAVQQAFYALAARSPVRPDLDKVAFVGHSLGGVIAANLAVRAAVAHALPIPRALMAVEPADPPLSSLATGQTHLSIMADYAQLPAGMLLLAVIGDEDRTAGGATALHLVRRAGVGAANKNLVLLQSDRHGDPPLVADHYAPTALPGAGDPEARTALPRWVQSLAVGAYGVLTGQRTVARRLKPPDALDFYGLWKLFDALTDAAFYGRHRDVALGNTPAQRDMGAWSDGAPVRPLRVWTAERLPDPATFLPGPGAPVAESGAP